MCYDTLCIGTGASKRCVSTVACCNSNVLCKSVCADRSGNGCCQGSSLLRGACVILLCFAESRDFALQWLRESCGMVLRQQIFFHLLRMVLFKFAFKKVLQNRRFFRLGVCDPVFGAAIYVAVVRKFHCVFGIQSLQIAHVGMFSMACLLQTCIDVTWLSGIQRGRVQLFCSRPCWHVLSGMFVRNLQRGDLAVRYLAGESAAVLLMLMLAC